jgi:dihydropyrimidinase
MSYETVVRGGTLVLPEGPVEADLAIRDGRIVALGRGLHGERSIDARGLLVLPGLIDPHVHPIHAETYASVSRAGLRGGMTTLAHHLYTPPDGDPVDTFEDARREANASTHVDFVFHVRLNDLARTAAAIPRLVERGSTSFKLFLAYGSRGVQLRDDELLLAMQAAERSGGLLLYHAENGHAADLLEAQARARGEDGLAAYYRARPRWLEAEAVERITRLLRIAQARSYLVHLTCRESLAAVRAAKDASLPVIGETCPHYLLLTAEEADPLGARAKMSPPLRADADREALWRALDEGLLSLVGSDHSAFSAEEKEASPDVFEAGYGVPGIATMAPLLYDRGVRTGRIRLARFVDVMAGAAARVLGLDDRKGALTVGRDADFVLFDPEAAFEIDAAAEGGAAYYSLYEGWRGKGVVRATYLRGAPAYADGEVLARPGDGAWLARSPAVTTEPAPVLP